MLELEPRHAVHPKGFEIEFHPEPHAYMVDGTTLTSVTTMIKRWFPEFDSETIARRKAEREGGSFEALVAEWARKRDDAALFGTKIHMMADTILQSGDEDAADELAVDAREKSYLTTIKESLRRIALGYDVVESEKIVFSPERRVAGTIDLLLRHKETGEFVVADWKTNREIKYASFNKEMGSGPCSHLANCNFIHYSLQTSAYGELLLSEGYLEGSVRGVLLHLSEKSGKVICDYVKTKDLRREIGDIWAAGH